MIPVAGLNSREQNKYPQKPNFRFFPQMAINKQTRKYKFKKTIDLRVFLIVFFVCRYQPTCDRCCVRPDPAFPFLGMQIIFFIPRNKSCQFLFGSRIRAERFSTPGELSIAFVR